jgi:hypothetical protein
MHFSNNAKRQLQQPASSHNKPEVHQLTGSVSNQRQRQQQFTRTYSSDAVQPHNTTVPTSKHSSVGLPAPGFSSRLQMGTSQRSN